MVLDCISPSEHTLERERDVISNCLFRTAAPQAFLLSTHRSTKEYFPSFSNTLTSAPPYNFILVVGSVVAFFPKLTVSDFAVVIPMSCLGFTTLQFTSHSSSIRRAADTRSLSSTWSIYVFWTLEKIKSISNMRTKILDVVRPISLLYWHSV